MPGRRVLALGLLPAALLRHTTVLWGAWLLTATAVAVLAAWLLVAARSPGHRAAALLTAGVLAWLLAPLFGPPGWLLRLPLLRGLLVVTGGYLRSLRPGFFPVDAHPANPGILRRPALSARTPRIAG